MEEKQSINSGQAQQPKGVERSGSRQTSQDAQREQQVVCANNDVDDSCPIEDDNTLAAHNPSANLSSELVLPNASSSTHVSSHYDNEPEGRPAGLGSSVALTKENAHEGDILTLEKFYLPRPDWGRPNQGTAHTRDKQKSSLVSLRRKHIIVNDLVVAKVDYGKSAKQPVSILKIVKLFQDRLRRQTWMRVRWYGEQDDTFLGKYYEKQEKLTPKMKKLMEKAIKQGVDVSQDIRFRITPDENIALTDEHGEQLVALIHWGPKKELLTKQHTLKENILTLIRTDIRLQDVDIDALIENAKRERNKKRRNESETIEHVRDIASQATVSGSSRSETSHEFSTRVNSTNSNKKRKHVK